MMLVWVDGGGEKEFGMKLTGAMTRAISYAHTTTALHQSASNTTVFNS
jgi:hypothetical protein